MLKIAATKNYYNAEFLANFKKTINGKVEYFTLPIRKDDKMATPFIIKKGLSNSLPTILTDGTIYFCTDTGEMYVGVA